MICAPTLRAVGCWILAVNCVVALLLTTGCRCALKHRGPFDNDIVAARELSRLGIEAMHRKSLPEAYARFAAAIKTNPDDVESRCQLARVLWQQGQPERAIEELDAAIEESGDHAEWTVELGRMLLAQNEFAGAVECANRALNNCGDRSGAWRLQAEVFQRTGRMNEALQAYHQALAGGDESAEVLSQIAAIYRQQGRSRRALSTLQRLEDEYPVEQHPQELGYWQGLALQSLGRHEDAVERFVASRKRMGDDPGLLASLRNSQSKIGGSPPAVNSELQLATATATAAPNGETHQAVAGSSPLPGGVIQLPAHLGGDKSMAVPAMSLDELR